MVNKFEKTLPRLTDVSYSTGFAALMIVGGLRAQNRGIDPLRR